MIGLVLVFQKEVKICLGFVFSKSLDQLSCMSVTNLLFQHKQQS